MRALIIAIILAVIPVACHAYGSPDFLPDGPHPRIWLTAEELTRLEAKRASNDASWTALESWCDTHVSDTGYDQKKPNWGDPNGYEMSGFAMHLLNYALGYQVIKNANPTKAATYAARAKELLINGIAIPFSAGEEVNGIIALRFHNFLPDNVSPNDRTLNTAEATALGIAAVSYKQGYTNRNLASVPIAYDWIYDTLSQADKDILAPMLFRWFDWIQGVRSTYNNGVLKSGVRYHEGSDGDCTGINSCSSITGSAAKALDFGKMSTNYNNGEMFLLSLIPVATYGYNTDAASYLTQWKSYLTNTVIPSLEGDTLHSGGDSAEGWNYGGGYTYLIQGLYGYYTATGDPAISNMTWIPGLMDSMVHRLMPDYINVPGWGYWVGAAFQNRKDVLQRFAGIEQRLHPDSNQSKLGQYLLNNVAYSNPSSLSLYINNMLWKRTDIPELAPSTQPLTHLAKGNGLFTSRSSWTNNNAVHLSVRLEGKKTADHESYDEGGIWLSRGSDRLLAYKDTEAAPSIYSNTVVFNGLSHWAPNPGMVAPAIDRTETGNGYSFVSGDITNAYKREWQPDRARLFRRSVLHVLPGFVVVYDVTRSNSTLGNIKEWYTQYGALPVTTADTISATVGGSKIFTKTLYPSGGAFATTNPSTGFYRVKYTPATAQEYDQFLHVIEATDSANNQTSTVSIEGSGGRGVVIGGITIAMFTSDQTGANITSLTYSADTSAASTHYIADLTPGATYEVSIDGGAATQYTASDAGLIVFTNPNHSPHTYSITQSGAPAVVPGSCGSSNGLSLSSAPVSGLCSAGTASAVSGTGPWSWSCAGSGGGSTANCSASLLESPPVGDSSTIVACPAMAEFR